MTVSFYLMFLCFVSNRTKKQIFLNLILAVCTSVRSYEYIKFEVLTDVVIKTFVFFYITPCRPLKLPTFRRNILFHAGFLLSLLFDYEDGDHIFFRNVG